MRNFKDLSRALASIAAGLKGIKDIIDTIEPGGGAGGIDYSTTEQDTGLKWTDGKTIYQKTYAATSPTGSSAANVVEITDLGVETIVDDEFVLAGSDGQGTFWSTGCGTDSVAFLYYRMNFEASGKDYIATTIGNANYRGKDMYITIRYTKKS